MLNNDKNIKNRVIATQYSATNMAQRTPRSPRYDVSITDAEPVVNTHNKDFSLRYDDAAFDPRRELPDALAELKHNGKECKLAAAVQGERGYPQSRR